MRVAMSCPAVRCCLALCVAAAALAARADTARAQDGAGTTGAQVLQLPAGSRAASLSGAYTAATGDADVVFYNPAGTASLRVGAGISHLRYVEDISFSSASGAFRLGPVVISAGAAFLDAGDFTVIEPDPEYGGQRGRETGVVVSAHESAARLAVALPLADGRLRIGAAAGAVMSDLAGENRSAALFDLGAQFDLPYVTLGASVINLGRTLRGADLADADLPTELRAGATLEIGGSSPLGALISADVATRPGEGTTALLAGIETGLRPRTPGGLGAVARLGFGSEGDDALGTLHVGAGLSLGPVAVDYTFQDLEFFGGVHRFGVRWAR